MFLKGWMGIKECSCTDDLRITFTRPIVHLHGFHFGLRWATTSGWIGRRACPTKKGSNGWWCPISRWPMFVNSFPAQSWNPLTCSVVRRSNVTPILHRQRILGRTPRIGSPAIGRELLLPTAATEAETRSLRAFFSNCFFLRRAITSA